MGRLPLLGTGLRAAAYPALLWNGARLHRAGVPDDDGLVLVALAAAERDADTAEVERAVTVGLAVAAELPSMTGGGTVIGRPTTRVVAAAACAAVATGTPLSGLDPVLDIAASLMVVAPPTATAARHPEFLAGHCLAAGWLAPRVLRAGLTGMESALSHTVATVIGRPAAGLPVMADVPAARPTGSHAGELLARLS